MHQVHHVIDTTTLHRLANWRGEPVVSSVYLDVDGTHRPVASDYEHTFERLADELRGWPAPEATQRSSPRSRPTSRRCRRGSRTASTGPQRGGWPCSPATSRAGSRPSTFLCRVRDEAALGSAPRIRQLVEAHDEPEPFILALVDRTHLRLFRVLGHAIDELPTTETHQERSVDTSTEIGSFERRDEEAARRHLRRAAAIVDEEVARWPVRQLIVGGPDDALAELERHVHASARDLIVGRAEVRVAAPVDGSAREARAVAARAERDREAALVEDVRQRAAGAHGGVVGLEAALAVLAEQRVSVLLVADGFSALGARCPVCGHMARPSPVPGVRHHQRRDR